MPNIFLFLLRISIKSTFFVLDIFGTLADSRFSVLVHISMISDSSLDPFF